MIERSPIWLGSRIKLVCLLPGDKELILYKQVCNTHSYVISVLISLPALLATYDGSQIVLFFCGTVDDGHSSQLSALDGYVPAYPLSLLFAFP